MRFKRRKNRAFAFALSTMAIVSFFTITTVTTTNSIFLFDNAIEEIPESYFSFNSDKTILYGFKPGITKEDILFCKTLRIPESVEEIAPSAFSFMFDGLSTFVSNLILNNNLKKIDDGAFKGCLGIKKVNWKDIKETSQLETLGKDAFEDSGIQQFIFPKSLKTISLLSKRCVPIIKWVLPSLISLIYCLCSCNGIKRENTAILIPNEAKRSFANS